MAVGSTTAVSKTYYDTSHDGTGTEQYRVTGVDSVKASDTATAMALTQYEYDATTGRQTAVISPDPDGTGSGNPAIRTVSESDDLGRATEVSTSQDGSSLIGKVVREYQGSRLKKVKQGNSETTTKYLTTTYYHDGLGNNTKVEQPSGAFTKTAYDLMGRTLATYLGTDEGTSTDPNTTTNDTIVEQTQYKYDTAGRVWLTTHCQRHPEVTNNDPLTTTNSRATYAAAWFDGLGRTIKTINYGTNGGNDLGGSTPDFDPDLANAQSYSNAPSPNKSKLCIVSTTEYDGFGRVHKTKDNGAKVTAVFYDDEGRKKYVVENFKDFNPSNESGIGGGANNDQDRVTKFTYNQLSLPKQQIALMATPQITRYIYEFEMSASGCTIRRPELLRAIIFPDSEDNFSGAIWAGAFDEGDTDHVSYTYYCNGARATATDQRGVVHTYSYDYLGRLKDDEVTTCPSGVDNTVLKITRAYDSNGRLESITSYNAADDGTALNGIKYAYNSWGMVTDSMQDHASTADSSDPTVDYSYTTTYHTSPEVKHIRLNYVEYPGPSTRRKVYYNYETTGAFAPLSRVANIADGDTSPTATYAAYGYFGASSVAKVEYPEVTVGNGHLALTYASGSSYSGFDRLGQVVAQTWAGQTTKDSFTYGYDANSSRLYRTNELSHTFDELYHANGSTGSYDGLDRLKDFRRGTLTASNQILDTVATASRAQQWALDAEGNWGGFKSTTQPSSWDHEQTRDHNKANEIEDDGDTGTDAIEQVTGAKWIDPAYDLAGNMTKGPKPGDEATGASMQLYVYDAWNRLTQVYTDADEQGDMDSGELVVTYSYDGRNRRIRKVLAVPDPDVTYDYYYNESWQVLEVRKGGSANSYEQYVWGLNYIDAPVVRFQDSDTNGTLNNTLYYTYDAQFNVTALIEPDGDVVERYVYDPYGKPTIYDDDWSDTKTWANSKQNDILYCGYRWDPESGLYQVRNRYYHPTLGRWVTRDPIGYADGMNLYQYCRSGPIANRDPYGLKTEGVEDPQVLLSKIREKLQTVDSHIKIVNKWLHACACVDNEKGNRREAERTFWKESHNVFQALHLYRGELKDMLSKIAKDREDALGTTLGAVSMAAGNLEGALGKITDNADRLFGDNIYISPQTWNAIENELVASGISREWWDKMVSATQEDGKITIAKSALGKVMQVADTVLKVNAIAGEKDPQARFLKGMSYALEVASIAVAVPVVSDLLGFYADATSAIADSFEQIEWDAGKYNIGVYERDLELISGKPKCEATTSAYAGAFVGTGWAVGRYPDLKIKPQE